MAVGGRINFEVDDGKFVGNCEMCKTTKFDGYCSKCEIHICQICFDNHLISKSCRDHLLQDAHSNATKRSTIRYELCEEHNHEVKVYCTEHKCCACTECILLRHKSCKWEYILPASEEFQSSGELLRLLEEVQGIEFTLDTYLEKIDQHQETAEALNTDAVSDIESLAKSLVEYVAESKQHVLEDANTRESEHQERLDKLKEYVQSLRSQAEEILTRFRNEDLLHKRFILAVENMPKVADIQNELATIDCNNVITDYSFRPSNMLNSMMSNTRPIGSLIEKTQIDNGQEDDDDIELKTERERNRSLQQELDKNKNELSKKVKDLGDKKQNYDEVVKEKQSMQQEISTLKSEHQKVIMEKQAVQQEMASLKSDHLKEKQTVQQEIYTLKSDHQRVVKEKQTMQQELSTLKLDHQRVVKENQGMQQDTSTLKSKLPPILRLSCGHEHQITPGRHNPLIKCGTCGIISGDQPAGTFTTNIRFGCIEMIFTFPNGTQSTLNRNPGQPYAGETVKGYLRDDEEGKTIMNMMKLAFDRKCLFTVNDNGNIKSGVELFEFWSTLTSSFHWLLYREYITRVRKQLQERGICNQ